MTATPTRPVVPYFGGKWKIADWICTHFPAHRSYVEAFGGAGSVLMKKKPSKVEVYNDLSAEIVNLFRVLRDPTSAKELRRQLKLTPYARTEWLNCYETSDDPIEQARRTVVLSIMSCNSGKAIRRQSNGWKSHSKNHTHPQSFRRHTDALELVTDRLQYVIIEDRDALKVIQQHDSPDTLTYADPPYLAAERKDKRAMYAVERLSNPEHRQLAEVLRNCKGFVIVSGYPSKEYKLWYEDFGWERRSTQMSDGSSQKGKSLRTECIWLNPKASEAQKQLKIF